MISRIRVLDCDHEIHDPAIFPQYELLKLYTYLVIELSGKLRYNLETPMCLHLPQIVIYIHSPKKVTDIFFGGIFYYSRFVITISENWDIKKIISLTFFGECILVCICISIYSTLLSKNTK